MKKKSRKRARVEYKEEGDLTIVEVPFEVKALEDQDDEFFRFEGLASTFGNIDLVDDIVMPGAFIKSLSEKDPKILWQHDRFEPIGMPEEVKEIPAGLFIRGKLPKEDSLVKGRVIPQMDVGSIDTMSIGFRVIKSEWNEDTGIRSLVEIDLHEVSLVTFAANPEARVTGFKKDGEEDFEVITMDHFENIKTKRDFEKALRDSGVFSKKAASFVAKDFQGDPEGGSADDGLVEGIKFLNDQFESSRVSRELTLMRKKLEN